MKRKTLLIHGAKIVNEGVCFDGSILIENDIIKDVYTDNTNLPESDEFIEVTGCYLMPGIIDEHVHFRDPGLTHKADVFTESCAAAAGGVTSVMDMPNTQPMTVTIDSLNAKLNNFKENSVVNYSCYFGATNDNYTSFSKLDKSRVCGIKLFLGASTGNMLVDSENGLKNVFKHANKIIVAHCEYQHIIKENTSKYVVDGDAPIARHPDIRSEEACYDSTVFAIKMAEEAGARLHVAHVSTAREMSLFDDKPLDRDKLITCEVCLPHLMFYDDDYATLGSRIKCNPAVKSLNDRDNLRNYICTNKVDTIATDHAPHLLSDKQGGALKAASGIPFVQFSLPSMLELVDEKVMTIETVVEKMCHNPSRLFGIEKRGFIRPGYKADITIVRPNCRWTVNKECIKSKCGWSPMEGHTFNWKVENTFVNGVCVYSNGHVFCSNRGEELMFE